jgi:hypothetical protein
MYVHVIHPAAKASPERSSSSLVEFEHSRRLRVMREDHSALLGTCNSQGSSSLNELGRPQRNSLVSSNGANRSRRLALKRTKCRVDVSNSTFITGTCDCFAGARLLLSRCYVELGRSALQTWTIGVKGANSLRFSVFFQWVLDVSQCKAR